MTDERVKALLALQSPCRLCPRECGAKRAEGERGFCEAGTEAVVASYGAHFGEERVLVGAGGSGTIFLSGCNLKCAFCQNHDISMAVTGAALGTKQLAAMMLHLEASGSANVNFVTPTHMAPQVAAAIVEARAAGMAVPVVYNCGGYESVEALAALEGLVEIYMPDAKFLDEGAAKRYLGAGDYPEKMKAAVKEMHRQVGTLMIERSAAKRGLLVRHLVMPGYGEDSRRVLDFLALEIGEGTYVNVMGQYRPAHRAGAFPEIARAPARGDVEAARSYGRRKGLVVDE